MWRGGRGGRLLPPLEGARAESIKTRASVEDGRKVIWKSRIYVVVGVTVLHTKSDA